MAIQVTEQQKQAMEAEGFAGSVATGGPNKQRYFRPDGQAVYMIPAIRQTVVVGADGKKRAGPSRDANYDKGFLPVPPQVPQLTCPHCTDWHKTQEEVDNCGIIRNARIQVYEKEAQEEHTKYEQEFSNNGETAVRMDRLEKMMETMTNALMALMAKGNGNG